MKTPLSIASILLSIFALGCGGSPSSPPPVQQWVVQTSGGLAVARDMHTATLLPDGKVLVVGGETQGNTAVPNMVASAELFDPASQTWSPAGTLLNRRYAHSSLLLPNGRVIVLGGWDLVDGMGLVGLMSVEEWNPTTRSFRVLGSLMHNHSGGQAFLRQDGRIQVVGGFDSNLQGFSDTLKTEIFDPVSGLSEFDFSLYELETSASLVPIDASHFMLLGGENGLGSWHQLNSAYLYATDGSEPNPSAGGTMSCEFARNDAVNLPSGKVVAGGGYNSRIGGISDTISIIDYAHLGSAILSAKMSKVRTGHQTMIFPDGTVGFVAGETSTGQASTAYVADIEVLDLTTLKTSILPASLHTPRTRHTLTRLHDGSFLITGGYNYLPPGGLSNSVSLNSCERLVFQ